MKPRPTKLKLTQKTWSKMNENFKAQKAKERERMGKVLSQQSSELLLGCWKKPVQSIVVSKFGSPRTLPNGYSYFHTGLDLRARLGTKIRAAAQGFVKHRNHMIVPGNVLVLDHGQGLFSRYLHLNEFQVKEEEMVSAGALIGLAGATGRVEAAHLHWEVVWKHRRLDPLKFIKSWNPYCIKNTTPCHPEGSLKNRDPC